MPIRVTMEIIPRGDESKKFTAGTLYIENDATGGHDIGNYDLILRGPTSEAEGEPLIPDDFWEKGRLEGFERKRGWWSCVREALNGLETDYTA